MSTPEKEQASESNTDENASDQKSVSTKSPKNLGVSQKSVQGEPEERKIEPHNYLGVSNK